MRFQKPFLTITKTIKIDSFIKAWEGERLL